MAVASAHHPAYKIEPPEKLQRLFSYAQLCFQGNSENPEHNNFSIAHMIFERILSEFGSHLFCLKTLQDVQRNNINALRHILQGRLMESHSQSEDDDLETYKALAHIDHVLKEVRGLRDKIKDSSASQDIRLFTEGVHQLTAIISDYSKEADCAIFADKPCFKLYMKLLEAREQQMQLWAAIPQDYII